MIDALLNNQRAFNEPLPPSVKNAGADRVDYALEGAAMVGHYGNSGRNAGPNTLPESVSRKFATTA